MDDQLSQEEMAHARELFVFFDKDRDGRIEAEEVLKLIRSLGLNPAEADVKRIVQEDLKHKATKQQRQVSAKRKAQVSLAGTVDFTQVLEILVRVQRKNESFEDLVKAFALFDKDKSGKVDVKELMEILVTKGEGMTPEEAQELIEFAQPTNKGEIDYVALIRSLQDMTKQF